MCSGGLMSLLRVKLSDLKSHKLALVDTLALYKHRVVLLSHLNSLGFTPVICDFI